MRALRAVLCWMMALEAVVCFWGGSVAVGRAAELTSESATRAALTELSTAAPIIILGGVLAAFSVAFWRRRPAARRWGMVSGGANVLLAAMVLLLVWMPLHSPANRGPGVQAGLLWAGLGMLALGVGTLAVFWRRDGKGAHEDGARGDGGSEDGQRGDGGAGSAPKKGTPELARIAGDGTHPVLDQMVWVVGLAAIVVGMEGWWRWSRGVKLPQTGWLGYFVEVVVADVAMVLVHELGHALAGRAAGMRLRAFVVGPFKWRMRQGRWRFVFRPRDWLATSGATGLVPTDTRQPVSREIATIAAGPAASLVSGLATLGFLLKAPGHAWAEGWALLALYTTFSLTAAVVNLAPFRTRMRYSDGAQMYQLARGGGLADYHRVMGMAGATALTKLRPRDFDILAMERAAGAIREGARAVQVRLLEYEYSLDSGQMREASQRLNEAESAALSTAEGIPTEFVTEFVFGKAFVQRDAEGTRAWWERLEAKKPAPTSADYWLARTASLWMAGRMAEAKDAWDRGFALAQKLPGAGAWEAERDKFAMLRRELDADRRVLRWHDDPALTH